MSFFFFAFSLPFATFVIFLDWPFTARLRTGCALALLQKNKRI
jgi:hypothetical protein